MHYPAIISNQTVAAEPVATGQRSIADGLADGFDRVVGWMVLRVINRLSIAAATALTVWTLIFGSYLVG